MAFIDSDVYVDNNWASRILEAYENGYKVGGGSISISNSQRNNMIALVQLYLQFNEYLEVAAKKNTKFVPSCNMYCEKELFNKIKGFPKIRASEDVLFGLRINKVEKIWFIPDIKAHHIFRENMRSFLKNQMLLGKYNIIYRRQYYDSTIYRSIFPLILLPIISFYKLLLIVYRVSKAGFGHIASFVYCFPLFLLGLICWSIGFAEGTIKNNVE